MHVHASKYGGKSQASPYSYHEEEVAMKDPAVLPYLKVVEEAVEEAEEG
jgi:hypothetical protein